MREQVWFCPRWNEFYIYSGEYLVSNRQYCSVGGMVDETGATYINGSFSYKLKDLKSFGWHKIGDL